MAPHKIQLYEQFEKEKYDCTRDKSATSLSSRSR